MDRYHFVVRGPFGNADLSFIDMADDDEAFYFAYGIIRDLTQGTDHLYAGWLLEITQGTRKVESMAFDNNEDFNHADSVSTSKLDEAYGQHKSRIIHQLQQQAQSE